MAATGNYIAAMELESKIEDATDNPGAVAEEMEKVFKTKTRSEWLDLLKGEWRSDCYKNQEKKKTGNSMQEFMQV